MANFSDIKSVLLSIPTKHGLNAPPPPPEVIVPVYLQFADPILFVKFQFLTWRLFRRVN